MKSLLLRCKWLIPDPSNRESPGYVTSCCHFVTTGTRSCWGSSGCFCYSQMLCVQDYLDSTSWSGCFSEHSENNLCFPLPYYHLLSIAAYLFGVISVRQSRCHSSFFSVACDSSFVPLPCFTISQTAVM